MRRNQPPPPMMTAKSEVSSLTPSNRYSVAAAAMRSLLPIINFTTMFDDASNRLQKLTPMPAPSPVTSPRLYARQPQRTLQLVLASAHGGTLRYWLVLQWACLKTSMKSVSIPVVDLL